jgi:succinate dehydrogenase/fumarate reductase cytochrome b subunit
MEILLLAAVVYHAFDGIRLLIVHYFKVTEYRKSLFYAIFVVSVILTIAGGIPILLFMLQGS